MAGKKKPYKPNKPKKQAPKKQARKKIVKKPREKNAIDWFIEGMPLQYLGPTIQEEGAVTLPHGGLCFVSTEGGHRKGCIKVVLDSHRTNREDTDVFFIDVHQLEPIYLPEIDPAVFTI